MDDDEIDDWLDSSDDEAGEAPGATPRPSTPSFLAETTPDSTPAREAVTAAPAEEAPEAAAVAAAPVGVDEAIKEAPSDARPAPPSGPTLSAVSVEPPALAVETAVERSSPVAEEMTVLSLSSPKAADLPEPEPEVGATDADSPAADAYVSLEDAFSHLGARERVPGASEDPKRSEAPATSAEEATPSRTSYPRRPFFAKTRTTRTTLTTLSERPKRGSPAVTARTRPGRCGAAAARRRRRTPKRFSASGRSRRVPRERQNAVAAVTTAASRSDLGSRTAADHVRGVGKELGTFAKHVAGEDLARRDDATTSANDEVHVVSRSATRRATMTLMTVMTVMTSGALSARWRSTRRSLSRRSPSRSRATRT